ncbi:MAG: winged helix-turn-helix transcriptional regulator [Candidatus Lokiarchaeota archaeon]|nr:winged helix-turn-helix transcriptional regulator [Candidatus Lokiarchaeota archaeon]MBD3199146.1 winged helix-turn-helix transcriptional regulator [Candidatus Lokiarchaeota archaeon]
MIRKSKFSKILFILLFVLFLFEFNILIINVFGDIKEPGYTYQHKLQAGNNAVFNFTSNNIIYRFSTDSNLDLNLEVDPQVSQRETSLFIKNQGIPLRINLTSKSSIDKYNLQKKPRGPSSDNFQYQFRYNYIIKMWANSSILNLTLQFFKNSQFGLKSNKDYVIGRYLDGNDTWEILETIEIFNDSIQESILQTEIIDFEGEQDYYITIFELERISYDWIWIVIFLSVIGVFAVVIILTKQDYINFLKTRTVPIDKGAHQLSLEEVLENKNRNKIIDAILEDPGIHFNELLRKTELAPGNLAWHLDVLETYKVIGKRRVGRYLVYLPYYQKNPISNIDLKLQKSELTLKVLEMIEEEPGIINKKMTKRLNVDHKTIHYHTNKLIKLDLIKAQKEGRKKKFYPNLEADYYNNTATPS